MKNNRGLFNIGTVLAMNRSNDDEYGRQLLALNDTIDQYGLVLTVEQTKDLLDTRRRALNENHRVEIGVGAVIPLSKKFAQSSYLDAGNFADGMNVILEMFYYYKTETRDTIPDDDLIDMLYDWFEYKYHGDLELMQNDYFEKAGKTSVEENTEEYDELLDEQDS